MKKLVIHLYAISFNEEVVMPHFLAHYSKFCDKIFLYDNFSTDRTPLICKQYANVELLKFETHGQIRDDVYLKIKNEVWKKSRSAADYVIVCDTDEFIYHKDLERFLADAHSSGITLFKPQGYNMISEHIPLATVPVFDQIQFGKRSISFDKIVIFNPDKIEEINYLSGAHDCMPIGDLVYSNYEIKLLHYKYISIGYILDRYKLFSQRLSKFNKINKLGFHYLYSSQKIKREFNAILKDAVNVFNIE